MNKAQTHQTALISQIGFVGITRLRQNNYSLNQRIRKKILDLNTGTSLATVLHTLDHNIRAKTISHKIQVFLLSALINLGELRI